jgi:hypothetical protein
MKKKPSRQIEQIFELTGADLLRVSQNYELYFPLLRHRAMLVLVDICRT